VNIQPDQLSGTGFFARQSVPRRCAAMVRGRLVAISAAPISGDSYADRARELVGANSICLMPADAGGTSCDGKLWVSS
jgi:predicted lysophospholipase L1 biosynthesis ABC-type transport system permease subunit